MEVAMKKLTMFLFSLLVVAGLGMTCELEGMFFSSFSNPDGCIFSDEWSNYECTQDSIESVELPDEIEDNNSTYTTDEDAIKEYDYIEENTPKAELRCANEITVLCYNQIKDISYLREAQNIGKQIVRSQRLIEQCWEKSEQPNKLSTSIKKLLKQTLNYQKTTSIKVREKHFPTQKLQNSKQGKQLNKTIKSIEECLSTLKNDKNATIENLYYEFNDVVTNMDTFSRLMGATEENKPQRTNKRKRKKENPQNKDDSLTKLKKHTRKKSFYKKLNLVKKWSIFN